MSAPHPLHLLLRCSNTLLREATRLLAPTGLNPAQFNILNLIDAQPAGARPSQIAADLVVDPSSATYLVRQMTALGWLQRFADGQDRRAYRLKLSPAGTALLRRARQTYLPALDAITAQLPAADLATLRHTLDHLLAHAPAVVDQHLTAAANDRVAP